MSILYVKYILPPSPVDGIQIVPINIAMIALPWSRNVQEVVGLIPGQVNIEDFKMVLGASLL